MHIDIFPCIVILVGHITHLWRDLAMLLAFLHRKHRECPSRARLHQLPEHHSATAVAVAVVEDGGEAAAWVAPP